MLDFVWDDTDSKYQVYKYNLEEPVNDSLIGTASYGHDFYSHKRVLRGKFPQASSAVVPDIYAVFDNTSMGSITMGSASDALNSWFQSYSSNGNTGKMYVVASNANGTYTGSEKWLGVPEMIVGGTLDMQPGKLPNSEVYVSTADGLGNVTTETFTPASNDSLQTAFSTMSGGWLPPTDLILISFFDESNSTYHDPSITTFPGTQPKTTYVRDFEHFVGTYSPLTGNSSKLNSFKGIVYPVLRGASANWNSGIPAGDANMLNNESAALVLQALAAWSGTTLTQNEIDGIDEFGNQTITGVLTDNTTGYGYTYSLISSNSNSGWDDGFEGVNVTPLLTSNPYSSLLDSNNDPGLWQHGWIISLDKRLFNTDGTQRSVFEPITFTNDINNLIGVDVSGASDPFVGIFPAGSIIFVEEAFYTINESLTFSAVGNFSIGLATATIDGYNSSQVQMYPPLASFGLSDSREVFFPSRSSADVYKHQGHTEISNSPLSIIKLTEPAMLMINFESESAKLQYGELTIHVPYIVDNPGPPIIKPEGPTAYISARPLILGSSSQFGWISSGGGSVSVAIDNNEVAFGTGTGITSSNFFKWDESRVNLLASTSSTFGKGNCTYRSAIIGGKCNCIDYGNDSSIIGGYQNKILSVTNSSIIIGSRCSKIENAEFSTIIGGWSSSVIGTSSFMTIMNSTRSVIKSSQIPGQGSFGSSIFGGGSHLIDVGSENSFILGGNANCIETSSNSVIIGGEFLCIQGENKLVYIPELKLHTVNDFQEGSCVLIWDNDKKVRRRTIASLAASMSTAAVSIDSSEVAFGNSTSTGITSSNNFTFKNDTNNLLVASQSIIIDNSGSKSTFNLIVGNSQSILGTVSNSSIIGGFCNCIFGGGYSKLTATEKSSNSSAIIGSWNSSVENSRTSVIVGSTGSVISESSQRSAIIASGQSNKSTTWSCIANSRSGSIISTYCGIVSQVLSSSINSSFRSLLQYTTNSSIVAATGSRICNSVNTGIFGGSCNYISGNSSTSRITNSSIIGGCCNCVYTSSLASIIGGFCNCLVCANSSTIISSMTSTASSVVGSALISIIASKGSNICTSTNCGTVIVSSDSSIVTGNNCNISIMSSRFGLICGGSGSSLAMLASDRSTIISINNCGTSNSSIISSCNSTIINQSARTAVIAGLSQSISGSTQSVIIAGDFGTVSLSNNSVLIGTTRGSILNSNASSIIGGSNNWICGGTSSVIVGGTGLTLSNVSNIVYVPKLKIATASISNTAPRVLVWDCTTCDVFWRCDTTIGGSPLIDASQIAFGCANSIGITSSSALSFSQSTFNTRIGDNVSTFGSGTCRSVLLSGSPVGLKGGNVITGSNNIIIGANYYSKVDTSQYSTILSGVKNCLTKGYLSSIISSGAINSCGICSSSHIASYIGTICDSFKSSVISTRSFCIGSSCYSSIIGGCNNTILSSTNSVIIGGKGLTLSNVNNQVITPSLCVSGALSLQVITASNNITLGTNNFTLLAWAPSSGAGMTVSLPSASVARHRMYVIKKMDASTQSFVFIRPNSGDNIEGTTTYITLENPYDYNMLQSDGVNTWIKLGGAVGINL